MMQKISRMNKKGEDILTPETLKTFLAVISLLILFGLAYKFYNVGSSVDSEKAEATLESVILKSESLTGENMAENLVIESPNEWSFVSLETNAWGLCENDFCLCLCEQSECEDRKSCLSTGEKFILLKDKEGKVGRTVNEEMPFGVQISLLNGAVYPFNVEAKTSSRDFSQARYQTLFFRFNSGFDSNGRWEWSLDGADWFTTNSDYLSDARLESLRDSDLGLKNKELILELDSTISNLNIPPEMSSDERKEFLRTKGIDLLSTKGIKESKGVIVFEVK